MKRSICLMLLFILLASIGITSFAATDKNNEAEIYNIKPAEFSVDAKSAVLMEANTGKILFSQNENEPAAPASVTKIMTLLLVMEAIEDGRINTDDTVTISQNAASMGGSQVFLKEGEEMSVRDLIKCTVIASANDAAVALSELVAGDEKNFVNMMNSKAAELGMKNTNFENTTGLDDTAKKHVSSALDIAIMSQELLKHTLILEYSSLWQDTIRNGEFTLTNTNRLVRYYDGCNGLKTGSTDKAGYCISATAKRNGMQLIAVVMGAETRDERNAIARSLLDYGFANYELYSFEEKKLDAISLHRGKNNSVSAYSKPFVALIEKGYKSKVQIIYEIPDYLVAPMKSEDVVGKIRFKINDKLLGETSIYVKDDIERITLLEIYVRMMKNSISSTKNKNDE